MMKKSDLLYITCLYNYLAREIVIHIDANWLTLSSLQKNPFKDLIQSINYL